jgi:nicotinamidase-related amidase
MRKAVVFSAAAAIALAIAASVDLSAEAYAQNILEEWASVKAPPPPTDKIKPVQIDPKKTAILSLDFNSKRCTPQARVRCFNILPRVEKVLAEARAKGMFVVHAVTSNMKNEDIVASVGPKPGEPILRGRGDKFSGNDLEKMLKDKGIDTVIVMGTSANSAVLYTVFGAVQRGFTPVVPIDTMPADTAYQEQFTIWQIANGSQLDEHAKLTRTDILKF